MSVARNLVDSCERYSYDSLFVCTKQIYGSCDAFGVVEPKTLYHKYCKRIAACLRKIDKERLIGLMHEIVWQKGQNELCLLLGYKKSEWRSMLTLKI